MGILGQVSYYLLFLLVGNVIALYTPIPAGIGGIAFAFILLCFGLIKIEDIEPFGRYILSIAGFILLPIFVDGWRYKEELLPYLGKWVLIIIVSTTLTLTIIALAIQTIQNLFLRSFSISSLHNDNENDSQV